MSFAPLANHTHFSLLNGVSKPKQIAKRCTELGYKAAGMMDHGNLGASVQFVKAMKDVCACGHQKDDHSEGGKCKNCACTGHTKNPIKPILGMEAYVSNDTSVKESSVQDLMYLPVIAKNLAGWNGLISATSHGYHKDQQYVTKEDKTYPRIQKDKLSEFSKGNMIAYSGHMWSEIANSIFINHKEAYTQTDYKKTKECYVYRDWENRVLRSIGEHIDLFGKDNFFLAVDFSGTSQIPAALIAARAVRYVSKKHKIPRVAISNSYYPLSEDADDQRVLLCNGLKTTQKEALRRVQRNDEAASYFRRNFLGYDLHIPSMEDLLVCNDQEELANSIRIADMCEEYDILSPPILPAYPCPDGIPPDEYLTKLCREGWRKKIAEVIPDSSHGEYRDRVKRELDVIKTAGLSSYFLIVQDYCNWARSVGMIVGPGRGSGAGSLVSYLTGITSLDPIKYGLIFERFYNPGRNTPGHISMPDIDSDFPVLRRSEIVDYLKAKFGYDYVANIATFNSLKGRGAFSAVCRAHNIEHELAKRITSLIPKPEKVSEELQAMVDRGDDPSVIRHGLESDPEAFREWVTIDEAGNCDGILGPIFAQSMRIEGTKTNISTHASGVVLATTPLADMCPMYYDSKIERYIALMEYPDLEQMGQVKLDVLGVNSLDKIESVRSLLRYGYIDKEDA